MGCVYVNRNLGDGIEPVSFPVEHLICNIFNNQFQCQRVFRKKFFQVSFENSTKPGHIPFYLRQI